jgi:CheY-like chemotaxis protein
MTDNTDQQNQGPLTGGARKPYVLIAEDAKFYAKVDQLQFESAGFEVLIVSDGQQLLDAARQRKPDIILLDLIMPVMDGFATITELKADPNLKDIKVLVFSNLSQQDDIERLKKLGATDFLVKTDLSPKALAEKVKGYLS